MPKCKTNARVEAKIIYTLALESSKLGTSTNYLLNKSNDWLWPMAISHHEIGTYM